MQFNKCALEYCYNFRPDPHVQNTRLYRKPSYFFASDYEWEFPCIRPRALSAGMNESDLYIPAVMINDICHLHREVPGRQELQLHKGLHNISVG